LKLKDPASIEAPEASFHQDASARGKIKLKTPLEATELIENMSANDHAICTTEFITPQRKAC